MKFSSIVLLALLSKLIQAAPAPGVHTVFMTTFITVIVDQHGATQTIIQDSPATEAPAPAPAPVVVEEAQAPEPVEEAPAPEPVEEAPEAVATPVAEPTFNAGVAQAAVPASPVAAAPATSVVTSVAPATQTGSASSSGSGSGSSSLHKGEGTFYSAGLGACGITSQDSDYIIAISHELYDEYTPSNNPNHNTLCGKKIRAYYGDNSVDVTVVDRCGGCKYNDLDFSPSAFKQLADPDLGRVDITWEWL
ncbi:DAG7 [Candida oxycetoniae]|uniref:DAG7 n=1 Tax=Candida oxycetoniae TaxID=497107 RepID=A0AAI9SUM3_9ASCO|nr:DAG7 [Candida oxycetoniae]KAI3403195.1 DAG7 [Candida oxycetoniae]